jgi:hypothetical protein
LHICYYAKKIRMAKYSGKFYTLQTNRQRHIYTYVDTRAHTSPTLKYSYTAGHCSWDHCNSWPFPIHVPCVWKELHSERYLCTLLVSTPF